MRKLAWLLVIAGAAWIVSEGLEFVGGERTAISLPLTVAFHALTAAGLWGALAGQPRGRTRLATVGVAMASLGYLALMYPPLAMARSDAVTIVEFLDANPVFNMASLLAVAGTIMYGSSIVRDRSYPAWTGAALVLCPILFTGAMTGGGLELFANAVNVVEALALVTIGWRAVRVYPRLTGVRG